MIACLALLVPAYNVFQPPTPLASRSVVLRSAPAAMAALRVTGQGVTVTEPMQEYAEGKLSKALERYDSMLNSAVPAEVHLKVEKRSVHDAEHHGKEAHIAEITAFCQDKAIVHACAESESMYSSLDELSDMLTRKLRKHKEKKMDVKQERRREDKKDVVEALVEDEDDE